MQISSNVAIKALMDDPLMIGRHRPIVAKWFQAWVNEYVESKRIPETEDVEMTALELKELILKRLDEVMTVNVENISLAPGYRKGTPFPDGHPRGKEVTVKFYGFRTNAKVDPNGISA